MDVRHINNFNKTTTFTIDVGNDNLPTHPPVNHQITLDFSAGIAAGSTVTVTAKSHYAAVASDIEDATFDAEALAGTSKILTLTGIVQRFTVTLSGFATGSVSALYVGW